MSRKKKIERRDLKRWSEEENARLIRQVRAFPQNLTKGFRIVAEELGRTEGAVSGHWYTVLSKRPDALCFFTASPHHVARNRKNGMGIESSNSIWRRLLNVIRNIC